MRVSLIIAVYKDVQALELIIESLKNQIYKNFEVIIAEDGESIEIKKFISTVKNLDIIHTTQEDLGVRKSQSQNNAIRASGGEYLIFIDGDCIPYSTFIQSHIKLAQEGYVASGRRVNLGPKYSNKLRIKEITSANLENNFILMYPFIAYDAKIEKHSENGFYFSPDGIIYNKLLKNRKSMPPLLGCNMAFFKKDIVAINGFDENYGESSIGSDMDLEWRFISYGLKIKCVKNIANLFHLYHKRGNTYLSNREDPLLKHYLELFEKNKKENIFICKNGLVHYNHNK